MKYCYIFITLIIISCPVKASHADSLPEFFMVTEDWKPYNFVENGELKGISVEVLLLMLEKIGSEQGLQDISVYPWIRAYKTTIETPNTILFTTTRTKKRENLFKWVGPIFEIDFNVYALRENNIHINSLADLKKYKIGTLRGDATEDVLVKKAGMKVRDFEQVSSNIQNTRKLALGRIDLAVHSEDTMLSTCMEAQIGCDKFEAVYTLDTKRMYYAFHKNTPEKIIRIFQRAFDEIKKEGKLEEIFKKYGK